MISQLPTGCLSFSVFQKPFPTLRAKGPPIGCLFLNKRIVPNV
ncbi:hypothetical protein J577_1912 [Acinetobacter sp. 263903-1]|uniref:Uncharacterized protein n=1 Tax=Acinetobacter radioresistens SK82 TaxID=596318 RepID=A0ABM9YPZ5_ACIRA|nr:hypothetical protein ACIRA0001_3102 [Acinetobacter radioresistens SK82]EXB80455.1 hypothetical protein J538_2989 [Acinetobacter sp. 272263]EXE56640.1 hypothetical protein J579_2368 [Acinetobacter sp. 1239920]KCX37136.1 hypothetical protein J577_1912 [Acinetobacter sp. 263903-1]